MHATQHIYMQHWIANRLQQFISLNSEQNFNMSENMLVEISKIRHLQGRYMQLARHSYGHPVDRTAPLSFNGLSDLSKEKEDIVSPGKESFEHLNGTLKDIKIVRKTPLTKNVIRKFTFLKDLSQRQQTNLLIELILAQAEWAIDSLTQLSINNIPIHCLNTDNIPKVIRDTAIDRITQATVVPR